MIDRCLPSTPEIPTLSVLKASSAVSEMSWSPVLVNCYTVTQLAANEVFLVVHTHPSRWRHGDDFPAALRFYFSIFSANPIGTGNGFRDVLGTVVSLLTNTHRVYRGSLRGSLPQVPDPAACSTPGTSYYTFGVPSAVYSTPVPGRLRDSRYNIYLGSLLRGKTDSSLT